MSSEELVSAPLEGAYMYIRCILVAMLGAMIAAAQPAAIRVDSGKVLHRVTPQYIGVNLEDLNYQVYGGLYSQLIHGESFQEHVDSAVLGLSGRPRLMVYVGENDRGELELWGVRGRQWEHNAAREALGVALKPEPAPAGPGFRPPGIPVALDELPTEKREALLAGASPERRVSRQWRSWVRGAAKATFGFERQSPFVGSQSQIITFAGGEGEAGVENAGLNRWGIPLVQAKPYEGLLRIKASRPITVWVSLLDSAGTAKLAEKALEVKPEDGYQRVAFTLTPRAGDEKGHFAITLKKPGSVTVGYAFLQPGSWGRFKDLPVRKDLDLVQPLIDQGVKVIRYNGSMVSRAPDGDLYKWKRMIGPRDLRPPYRGNFNPYASNGFGIFDFLNLTEAAGFLPIPGIRIDETPEDMADFVEYVNGPANTTWGQRRAADGHPAPYGLKHLEIGNEEAMNEHYCERFEMLAQAIWAKDPGMVLLVTHNLGQDPKVWEVGAGGEVSERLKNAVRLVRFAQARKGVIWWDSHYRAELSEYEQPGPTPAIASIRALKQSADKLVPGYHLLMAPLEENGPNHDMRRALAHARNLNAFFRLGDYLPAVAVANALQAWQQDLVWNQGRIVFTATKTIPQPPYYVDQVIARNWAPNVVETTVDGTLDAQARTTADGRFLVLHVVNDKSEPVEASLTIAGFTVGRKAAAVTELTGSYDAINTPEDPGKVRPQTRDWNHGAGSGVMRYAFPPRSVTLLRFER